MHDYKAAENLANSALFSLAGSVATPMAVDLEVMNIKALTSDLACEMVDAAQGMESRRLMSRFIEIRIALAAGSLRAGRDAVDKIDNVVALLR